MVQRPAATPLDLDVDLLFTAMNRKEVHVYRIEYTTKLTTNSSTVTVTVANDWLIETNGLFVFFLFLF